jgi:hypothetical protein
VRLSADRLRSQYLPDNSTCFYVKVTVDGQLAGNAFACRWTASDKIVCWVTQLVVDRNYRERGLAKCLLNQLKQIDVDIYGLMSSHPAACLAAAKAFGGKRPEFLHYGIISKNYRLYQYTPTWPYRKICGRDYGSVPYKLYQGCQTPR